MAKYEVVIPSLGTIAIKSDSFGQVIAYAHENKWTVYYHGWLIYDGYMDCYDDTLLDFAKANEEQYLQYCEERAHAET